jgi:hypothetical protein
MSNIQDINRNNPDITMPKEQFDALMADVQNIVDQMPEAEPEQLSTMALEIAMVSTQIDGEGEEVESLKAMCRTGAAALFYINVLHAKHEELGLENRQLKLEAGKLVY